MNEEVFLTGATGFIGTQVARYIISNTDADIRCLVRAFNEEVAFHRLRRTWHEWPELIQALGSRVHVEAGDLTYPGFGMKSTDLKRISSRVTRIIHCAADLRLDGPIDEMRRMNVEATAQVLDLARNTSEVRGFHRFLYVSTAYVAGLRTGDIPEDLPDNHPEFANTYEMTKFEAELMVWGASREFPVTIVRPGMVVGDSDNGFITTFNTVYYPLRLYLTRGLRIFPSRADHRAS